MRWPRVTRLEPLRSRLVILAGGVLALAGAAAFVWGSGGSLGWLTLAFVWLVVVVTIYIVGLWLQLRANTPASRWARPARFAATGNRLAAATLPSAALAAIPQMMMFTTVWAVLLPSLWREDNGGDPAGTTVQLVMGTVETAMGVVQVLLVAAIVVFAWRGTAVELTPIGVHLRGPLFHRLIPWQALAPGGPQRLPLNGDWLQLAVVRPELVMQRGCALGFGSRRRPRVGLQVNVHPWFLADTIRWYVEHPADRDAIGGLGEQERLIAALTAPPVNQWPWAWQAPRAPES